MRMSLRRQPGWWSPLLLPAFVVILNCVAMCRSHPSINVYLRTGILQLGNERSTSQQPPMQDFDSLPAGLPALLRAQSFYVSYADASSRDALHQYLTRKAALIYSYVPDNTWLVHTTTYVISAVLEQGLAVYAVPCTSQHKIAPEWSGLLEDGGVASGWAVAGSGSTSGSSSSAAASALENSAVNEGGKKKYIITAQIFSPATFGNSDATRALAKQLAASWLQPLADVIRAAEPNRSQDAAAACTPRLRARGQLLQAVVCASDTATAITWLAARSEVHWLEPTPRLTRRDIWGDLLVQAGGRGLGEAAYAQPTNVAGHRFWSRGLDGNAQVVGISDTGLDTDSCYFFDPLVPDVWRRMVYDPTGLCGKVLNTAAHRKLASYCAFQDFGDADGHGTHVTGIAVGACSSPATPPSPPLSPPPKPKRRPPPPPGNATDDSSTAGPAATVVQSQLPYIVDEATGMAPGARLAFYDIMDRQGTYGLPPYGDLLSYQLGAGALIESDSWGSKQTYWYNSLSQQLDEFLWHYPQLLVLNAAGNDGRTQPPPPNGTVSAPANAKNSVAVGSSVSATSSSGNEGSLWLQLWTGGPDPASANAAASSNGSTAPAPPPGINASLQLNLYFQLNTTASDFRTLRDLDGSVLEIVVAAPSTACRKLTNAAQIKPAASSGLPKLAVLLQGSCALANKVAAAATAGAAAVAIANDSPGPQTVLIGNTNNATLPVAGLQQAVGQQLITALSAGLRVFARASWQPRALYDNIPSYSAYGPTWDGRIKPDVVTPGVNVLSAYTDFVAAGLSDGCKLRQRLSGTSMSAPLAAGAAALARQYFTTGFYPLGRNDTPGAAPFAPSGMLLKAVLIGGAYDMSGVSEQTLLPLQPTPSALQGYGRVDLSRSLPLSDDPTTASAPPPPPPTTTTASATCSPRLQLVDLVPISEGAVHSYRLTARAAGPIVVTLVWVDVPADLRADVALVNNLDLQVVITPATANATAGATGSSSNATQTVVVWGNPGWNRGIGARNWGIGSSGGGGVNSTSNGSGADDRNNVERVTIGSDVTGTLEVRVLGTAINSRFISRFASDVQRYALTVHGCFSGLLVSKYNPDPRAKPPPPPSSPPSPTPPKKATKKPPSSLRHRI
ncbi:hypothetical protein Agub_g1899 [Astrephomene gubernaculifera]|uniref:Peptidase S8/S53 domain-containing protein n=1 Tax=Astrephomene gubernaculifera TaxID=47775 RepID=A0AAD3HHY2_9CHLO|nr:hypothetical protein Agub_g1899 [Astrephomene gubernaculifera]